MPSDCKMNTQLFLRLWSKKNFNREIQILMLNISVTFFRNKVCCVADGKKMIQMIGLIHRCWCFSLFRFVILFLLVRRRHILFFAFRLVKITVPQVGPRNLNPYAHIIIDPPPHNKPCFIWMTVTPRLLSLFLWNNPQPWPKNQDRLVGPLCVM